ncbi:MAG TPA: polysaccharide deacetylase family protein [Terriglobales bacterium]|nr:polysaccharide deacetylase family protein [Terriglobales bacterium]
MTLSPKTVGVGLICGSGLPRLLHSWVYPSQVGILMYHAVIREPLPVPDWCFLAEDAFRQQIAYVKEHFRVVSLSEAVERLAAGSVEEPTMAITFDDGYENNFSVALPILNEYQCPATIFLATAYTGTPRTTWWCRLNRALALTKASHLEWEGMHFGLEDRQQKAGASASLQSVLKSRHPYSIDGLVDDICGQLGVDPSQPVAENSPYQMLGAERIGEMVNTEMIEFGAHTHTHTILSLLSPEDQRNEILGSVDAVRQLTGRACKLFAYPNGGTGDYNQNSIKLLKSAGVTVAVSGIGGPNTGETSTMEMRRYTVGADLDFMSFRMRAHHLTYHMKGLGLSRN